MRRVIAILALIALGATGCEHEKSNREQDRKAQQDTLSRLRAEIPVPRVEYAPTRRNVAEWIRRWDQPDKVSFVYLMADNGQVLGYYVANGLPTTYCAALTAPDEIHWSANGNFVTSAPALDGVYYGGSGDCNHYYLFEATTGAYIEFGGGIRFFASDQPLQIEAPPLSVTTVEDATRPNFTPVPPETGREG